MDDKNSDTFGGNTSSFHVFILSQAMLCVCCVEFLHLCEYINCSCSKDCLDNT